MTPSIVDIGLNLTHDSFSHDLEPLLKRAADAGVHYMIVTGSSIAATRAAIEMAQRFPDRLRATAGVHPHHAGDFATDQLPVLEELLARPEVVATGECGLDYFRNFSPHADQERAFRAQLELATRIKKPLFLHQRDAHDAFVQILKEYLPRTAGGVAHCFTAGMREATDYLEMGLYLGITGWLCDERRGQHLREVVRNIPLDRMLIETDAPYLLPRDLRPMPSSRRNEPMYLAHVLSAVAACRHEDVASIAAATTENSRRLFGWPSPAV